MKRLPFLLFFLLSFVVAKGQQVHQAPTFIFNASGPIPAGNHIFEAVQYVEFQEGSDYNAINGESLEAKINPYLLFPPTGGEIGGPKTGDDGVVGAISGSLDVSQSGAANYSIPIEIPDGVAGMKPNISFRYNSLSGNGPLGIGWSLSGFSSINRTSTDFYHDGPNIGVNGVHFDQNDQFTLDGQRLIDINNSTYGSEGAEYRTEIQSFVKIISHGSAGNGPSWFEAWTKDGKIIEYGSTNDSRIEAPGKTDVFFWMVSKIRDRQGNYISFEYNENGDMTCSPSRITYTGNSTINPTIVPFYAVEFTYEGRPDRSTNFLGGSYINMNLRLSKIDIRYLPTQAIYKEYTLTYTNSVDSTINSISNYYSHLQSVGVNDGTSTHLNPTVFEWGNQPSQFELHNVMSPERYEVITGDYNGDGKTDIVRAYNYESSGHKIYTSWELFLANSNGTDFNHFINAGGGNLGDGCQGFISGDFNGDGMSDLMELYDNWWNEDPHDHLALFLAKTGNTGFEGFYPVQTVQGFSMSTDYRFMGIQVGDFNGDGLEDIAVRCSHKSDYEKYSDEYDCKVLLSNFDAVNNIVSLTEIPNITNINRFYVGNFYDKTRKDLLVLKNSICSIYFWNNQLNNFSKLTPDFGYPTKYHTIFPADFNGDGITDVLTCIRTSDTDVLWELTEFTGKEQWPWPTVPITFLPNANPYDNEGHYNVFPCDYNGDGKSDIMSIDAYTKQVKFFFSKGKGEFINTPEITSIDAFGISSNHFSFTDFNGDGIADILYYKSIFDPLILLLVHPNDNSELVKKITNGFGKIDKITYHPLTTSIYQKYFTTYAATLATVKDFQGPLHVVSITESDNGKGGFLSRTYSYEGALIQRINNEFLGFSKVTTTDHSTGIISKNTYDYLITYEGNPNSNSFYFPHLVKSETFFGQHLISETENIYKAYQYFPNLPLTGLKAKLILPYLTKSNSKSWEIDGNTYIKTSRSTIGYSASSLPYGNPIVTSKLNDSSQIAIAEPDNSFTFKESVSTTYYPYDETNWIISNVDTSTTQTFIKNLGFQTKVRQFVYYPVGDANGRTQLLWKDIIEPGNDPLSVLTEYDYDPNGNIKSKRLSAPNANPPIPSRLTTYEYNPVYQSRFITKITDPLNHFAESDFDPLTGNLASETDINNLSSTHLSDIFGTNSKTEAPDGTKNIIILRWKNGQAEAPGDALFLSWEQTSGNSEIYTYYDKLGRVLRKVTKGFNDRSIFVDQEYDVYGRPTKTSDPYFSGDSPLYTEKKYNTALSRVDYQIFPDQTHVWYTYHGPTTITTNEAGQPKTQKKNAIDLLDESTDANSRTVKYEYAYQGNDFISTVAIDNLSATQTVIKIDKFGNRINIIDPSSGSIEETYNAFGE
ncbi:MAG: FG-GAP-like repeat-containing protein, partial [Bacteroidales bacterium]|nr:FG-GAP-like repeat-containing protein [Bacteroidales bacterium]